MEEFYPLVLASLVVWRLTHLFHAEDGPWDLLVKLRRLAGHGFWSGLLDCFYCLSLWLAAPAAILLAHNGSQAIALWLAVSGAACLLERATSSTAPAPPPAIYKEDLEE